MEFLRQLFGQKQAAEYEPSFEMPISTAEALKRGEIGEVMHLVLRFRDTKRRDVESRKPLLGEAYSKMRERCPGLLLPDSSIVIDKKSAEPDAIMIGARFLSKRDGLWFQAECFRILARYGFET
jgi:hypothetical protein